MFNNDYLYLGSGSGGYSDHVFRKAAQEIHEQSVENIQYTTLKNQVNNKILFYDFLKEKIKIQPFLISNFRGLKFQAQTFLLYINNLYFSKDFKEVTLTRPSDGAVLLKFAIANGFRNIQNLVQKMKRKRCDYDFVEIMACPSGCINGGAQIR